MIRSDQRRVRAGGSRIGFLLLSLVLLLGASFPAQAEDCSDYPGGVIDGFAGNPAPSQLQIDRNCTIQNFPASNPLSTNFSFLTQPGQTDERWLVVFDNVVHTGQMACNSVSGHKIWFTNGSSTSIQEGCQNLLTRRGEDRQAKSSWPEHGHHRCAIHLHAHEACAVRSEHGHRHQHQWLAQRPARRHGLGRSQRDGRGPHLSEPRRLLGEQRCSHVLHTFSNVGGFLTFDAFPVIPAGEQVVIELTVVLDDSPTNVGGTQFVNTAKWDFGRLDRWTSTTSPSRASGGSRHP